MFFAILFWGFSFVWSKQVLEIYKPITVIYIRLILSVLFLFLVGKILNKLEKIDKKDYRMFLFIAFFEPFTYFIGENFGLTHVSSTVAAVIISTIPLFSIVAAYFFTKERIGLGNFFGIVLSIIGVFLVILKDNLQFNASLFGIGFMFLAVLAAVSYSVVVLKIAKKYNVFSIIFYQNLIGIVMFTPIFFLFDLKDFIEIPFSWTTWLPLIKLAVFASTFAFMLFTYGIKHLGVTRANTISNLIPIVTAVFSFFVLNERLSNMNMFGIFIVVVGLILSQIKKKNIIQSSN